MEQPPFQGKTWGLTPYEMNRGPQEAVTDNTEIAVSPRSLHNELMCPICLDMLKNTMTTKECLHRFCQDCIITALRSGNKECPTCRKKLVSKRSLRPDPNFDALISKIYPSRDEYEAHQERVLERLKQSMNQEAFNQNIEEGLRQQALSRNPRRRPPDAADETRKHCSDESNPAFDATDAGSTSGGAQVAPEVELVFKPHPSQASSEAPPTRYIKTTSNASIEHLSKYLAMRIALEKLNITTHAGMLASSPSDKYKIYVMITKAENNNNNSNNSNNNNTEFLTLPPHLSLAQTSEQYWHSTRPIELYYSLDV